MALAWPFAALKRRGAAGGAGLPEGRSWSRRRVGELTALTLTVKAPWSRAAETIGAVTVRVTDALLSAGATVGIVGVVQGEEPVLVALAARRDLVAPRVRDALGEGETHRRRNLWLPLAPATYLATCVDPYRPFAGDDDEIAAIVASGSAPLVISTRAAADRAGLRIEIVGYGRRSGLRAFLSAARKGREAGSGRAAAR